MGLDIGINVILAYAFGLILLYIIGWLLIIPIKIIVKLIINGVIGGVILVILNLIGKLIGFSIGINVVTALIVGFLGIPGVILLIILRLIL